MKRITTLVMALAMILTLAACGGKNADQPSNNTPPVTQGEQNQPNNTPDDTQPSEPTDTTPNEPQNNAGALPEGGYYLYDGEHYLSAIGDINFTVISGKKSANTTHEMSVEQAESVSGRVCGLMSFVLGQNEEPYDYQISFADESKAEYNGIGKSVAPGGTETFSIADAFAWVTNTSSEEKTVANCPIFYFMVDGIPDEVRNEALDGQPIAKLNDLINVLGTPTAAYCAGGAEATYYIWQFEDYIYTAWVQPMEIEDKFDEARQSLYFDVNWDTAEVYSLSYYALNYGVDETQFNLWTTTWSVQVLTDLGLL